MVVAAARVTVPPQVLAPERFCRAPVPATPLPVSDRASLPTEMEFCNWRVALTPTVVP